LIRWNFVLSPESIESVPEGTVRLQKVPDASAYFIQAKINARGQIEKDGLAANLPEYNIAGYPDSVIQRKLFCPHSVCLRAFPLESPLGAGNRVKKYG
jgi:hypothetical protein